MSSFAHRVEELAVLFLAHLQRFLGLFSLRDVEVHAGNHRLTRVVATYGDGVPGAPLALIGSSRRLEIAVANGNAAAQLGITIGGTIQVRPRSLAARPIMPLCRRRLIASRCRRDSIPPTA